MVSLWRQQRASPKATSLSPFLCFACFQLPHLPRNEKQPEVSRRSPTFKLHSMDLTVQCGPVSSSVARFSGCRISFNDIWRNSLDGGTAGRKVCTHTQKRIHTTRLQMPASQTLLNPLFSRSIKQCMPQRARQLWPTVFSFTIFQ